MPFRPSNCFSLVLAFALVAVAPHLAADEIPGFDTRGAFHEQVREIHWESGARAVVNAPSAAQFDASHPTLLAIFATPNGNTIEQTAGLRTSGDMDWHFDIQHIAAQTRFLRDYMRDDNGQAPRNLVVAYMETDLRSWPTWRKRHDDSSAQIVGFVGELRALIPGDVAVCLTGHSGGGSFTFGYLNGVDAIGPEIERIAFLDSNYGFEAEEHHGEKLLAWLAGSRRRRLVVVAYDDRNIELNGKRVVSDTGGTYRATHRMVDAMGEALHLTNKEEGDWLHFADWRDESWAQSEEGHRDYAAGALVDFRINKNPENKILHTVMVGEMNGFVHAIIVGSGYEYEQSVTPLLKPRLYTDFIEEPPSTETSAETTSADNPSTATASN